MANVLSWSTNQVAPRQRLDFYTAWVGSALTPMQVDPIGERESFECDMAMMEVGAVFAHRQIGSAHRCFHDMRDIAKSEERNFHLLINLAPSPWQVEHRGRFHLERGDALLFDTNFPFNIHLTHGFDILNFKVSDTWLRQWIPVPAVVAGRRFPWNSGWSRALTSFAAQLTPDFLAASPLAPTVVADQMGAMLAILASEIDGSIKGASKGDRELRSRIVDCIVQRSCEIALTAEDVAVSLNVSVRTVHRSLAAKGETFGALLQAARAEAALRMLESPLWHRLSIAEIGRRAGFADASHFARVLRARNGRTPSQIRRDAGMSASES